VATCPSGGSLRTFIGISSRSSCSSLRRRPTSMHAGSIRLFADLVCDPLGGFSTKFRFRQVNRTVASRVRHRSSMSRGNSSHPLGLRAIVLLIRAGSYIIRRCEEHRLNCRSAFRDITSMALRGPSDCYCTAASLWPRLLHAGNCKKAGPPRAASLNSGSHRNKAQCQHLRRQTCEFPDAS